MADRSSFEAIEEWKAQTNKYCTESIKVCLIGNKADCANKREVTTEEGVVKNLNHMEGFSKEIGNFIFGNISQNLR